MDLTRSGCGVYVQGQAAELRKGRSKGDAILFILLFLLSSLSLPIFVFIIVRYAQAPGIKDPFGVQGFAMALARALQYSGPVITHRVEHGRQIQYNTILK